MNTVPGLFVYSTQPNKRHQCAKLSAFGATSGDPSLSAQAYGMTIPLPAFTESLISFQSSVSEPNRLIVTAIPQWEVSCARSVAEPISPSLVKLWILASPRIEPPRDMFLVRQPPVGSSKERF